MNPATGINNKKMMIKCGKFRGEVDALIYVAIRAKNQKTKRRRIIVLAHKLRSGFLLRPNRSPAVLDGRLLVTEVDDQ